MVTCGAPAKPAAQVSLSCDARNASTSSAADVRGIGGPGAEGRITTAPSFVSLRRRFETDWRTARERFTIRSSASGSSCAFLDASLAAAKRSRTPGPNPSRVSSCASIQAPSALHTSRVWRFRNASHHSTRGGAGGSASEPSLPSPPSRTVCASRKTRAFFAAKCSTHRRTMSAVTSSHASSASSARTAREKDSLHASSGNNASPPRCSVFASRANQPRVSKEGARGTHPRMETAPCVGLNPNTPQYDAGTRTLPAVSVPSAKSQKPAATAAALPLDDPPGMRSGAAGLTGVP
mmetsp:Transcript_5624/g.23826  ORF Transcript_5624/g.23826 Transcript_5624/m.23826 type:complete len:293 (-) Transcript_5624:450-1328(-)